MKPMKELNEKQQSEHDNATQCYICKKKKDLVPIKVFKKLEIIVIIQVIIEVQLILFVT